MKYLIPVMIVIGLLFAVNRAYADDPPGEVDPENEAPATAELGGECGGNADSIGGNVWGCNGKSHWPYQSTDTPGRGWINAKSDIVCNAAPPAQSWSMLQTLFRSSYYGWELVGVKYSECPTRVGAPYCGATKMRAYTTWRCLPGTTYYNYRLVTRHQLNVGV